MMHTIYVFENTLSDGSHTYDVSLNACWSIAAVSFEDACRMAEAFQTAILGGSNDDVRILSRRGTYI